MPCYIKYYSPQGSVCTLYLTQALPFPTLLSLSDSALVFGLLQLLLAAALVHPQHGLVLQVGDDD